MRSQNQIANQTLIVESAVQKKVENKIQEATFFIQSPMPAVTLSVDSAKVEVNKAEAQDSLELLENQAPVDTASVSETIGIALLADTSYPLFVDNTLMGTVAGVEAGSANVDNIVWSPFSTTTPEATSATQSNLDWTNGYGLPGFPSNTAFPVQTWTRAN